MVGNDLCEKCYLKNDCDFECQAMDALKKVCLAQDAAAKTELLKSYSQDLDLVDYETADDLKLLGEKVIAAMPELYMIREYGVRIGYVRSYESKQGKGKSINAECRKVTGTYTAYLPFDFLITFYEPNIYYMSDNQKKILMLHELRHIGMGEKGLKIENHDVEDFADILHRFGIEWNGFNQDVPDILAGGGVEEASGRKRQEMAAKPGAVKTSGNAGKSGRSKNQKG